MDITEHSQIADLTIVLTNYRRPNNLKPILEAINNSTVLPERVVLVDNSGGVPRFSPARELTEVFHDVVHFEDNAGPSCRFAGAIFQPTKYCMFLDDDFVIGSQWVTTCLSVAALHDDKFSTITGIARNCRGRGGGSRKKYRLRGSNVPRDTKAARGIDVSCRGHFIKTRAVASAIKWRLLAKEEGLPESALRNDDMFLALGSQLDYGEMSYLAPAARPEQKMVFRNLSAPHACSAHSDHNHSRQVLIEWFTRKGWRSLKRNGG